MKCGLRCTSTWTSGPSPMQRKPWISPALMTRMSPAPASKFLMRASFKRQIFLADAVHPAGAPAGGSSKHPAIRALARRKRHAELNQGHAGRAGDVAAVELHGAADDAEDRVEVGSEVERPAHGELIADPHLRTEPR